MLKKVIENHGDKLREVAESNTVRDENGKALWRDDEDVSNLLRKVLWTIQKLATELNLDYDQVNELYHNVMDEISCELEKLK